MPSFLSKVLRRKRDDKEGSSPSEGELLGGKFEDVSPTVSPSAAKFAELTGHAEFRGRNEERSKDKDHALRTFFRSRSRARSPPRRPRPVEEIPQLSLSILNNDHELHASHPLLSDLAIGEHRLTPAEALNLIRVCSQALTVRGIDTLGIMHPHWHSASPEIQRALISLYIRSSTTPSFESEISSARSPHDVAAVFRWALRHLALEGVSFGNDQDWYHTFFDQERTKEYPPKAFSETLGPLVPASHFELLKQVLDTFSSLASHAETNSTSGSKLSKLFGLWLLNSSRSDVNDDWNAFYDRWDVAGRQLEHLFLAHIRNEAAEHRIPIRLLGLVKKYPPSPTTDLRLLPRPKFTTRLYDALFVRVETELPNESLRPTSKTHPLRVVAEVLSANAEDGDLTSLWSKIVATSKAEGSGSPLTRIFADETIRFLLMVPDGPQSDDPILSPIVALVPQGPGSPRREAFSLREFTSEIKRANSTQSQSTTEETPVSALSADWSVFSSAGFSATTPLTPLASTLFGTDIERTPPTLISRRPSRHGKSPSTSSPRKSIDFSDEAKSKASAEGVDETIKLSSKISSIRMIQLDEAFIDFWSDSLLDPVSSKWPSFVVCKVKPSLASQLLYGEEGNQKTLQWVVLEQAFTVKPRPPPQRRPSSPGGESSHERPSSPSSLGKKRFAFWSASRSHSLASVVSLKSKKDNKDGARVSEMGEVLEEDSGNQEGRDEGHRLSRLSIATVKKDKKREPVVRVRVPSPKPRKSTEVPRKSIDANVVAAQPASPSGEPKEERSKELEAAAVAGAAAVVGTATVVAATQAGGEEESEKKPEAAEETQKDRLAPVVEDVQEETQGLAPVVEESKEDTPTPVVVEEAKEEVPVEPVEGTREVAAPVAEEIKVDKAAPVEEESIAKPEEVSSEPPVEVLATQQAPTPEDVTPKAEEIADTLVLQGDSKDAAATIVALKAEEAPLVEDKPAQAEPIVAITAETAAEEPKPVVEEVPRTQGEDAQQSVPPVDDDSQTKKASVAVDAKDVVDETPVVEESEVQLAETEEGTQPPATRAAEAALADHTSVVEPVVEDLAPKPEDSTVPLEAPKEELKVNTPTPVVEEEATVSAETVPVPIEEPISKPSLPEPASEQQTASGDNDAFVEIVHKIVEVDKIVPPPEITELQGTAADSAQAESSVKSEQEVVDSITPQDEEVLEVPAVPASSTSDVQDIPAESVEEPAVVQAQVQEAEITEPKVQPRSTEESQSNQEASATVLTTEDTAAETIADTQPSVSDSDNVVLEDQDISESIDIKTDEIPKATAEGGLGPAFESDTPNTNTVVLNTGGDAAVDNDINNGDTANVETQSDAKETVPDVVTDHADATVPPTSLTSQDVPLTPTAAREVPGPSDEVEPSIPAVQDDTDSIEVEVKQEALNERSIESQPPAPVDDATSEPVAASVETAESAQEKPPASLEDATSEPVAASVETAESALEETPASVEEPAEEKTSTEVPTNDATEKGDGLVPDVEVATAPVHDGSEPASIEETSEVTLPEDEPTFTLEEQREEANATAITKDDPAVQLQDSKVVQEVIEKDGAELSGSDQVLPVAEEVDAALIEEVPSSDPTLQDAPAVEATDEFTAEQPLTTQGDLVQPSIETPTEPVTQHDEPLVQSEKTQTEPVEEVAFSVEVEEPHDAAEPDIVNVPLDEPALNETEAPAYPVAPAPVTLEQTEAETSAASELIPTDEGITNLDDSIPSKDDLEPTDPVIEPTKDVEDITVEGGKEDSQSDAAETVDTVVAETPATETEPVVEVAEIPPEDQTFDVESAGVEEPIHATEAVGQSEQTVDKEEVAADAPVEKDAVVQEEVDTVVPVVEGEQPVTGETTDVTLEQEPVTTEELPQDVPPIQPEVIVESEVATVEEEPEPPAAEIVEEGELASPDASKPTEETDTVVEVTSRSVEAEGPVVPKAEVEERAIESVPEVIENQPTKIEEKASELAPEDVADQPGAPAIEATPTDPIPTVELDEALDSTADVPHVDITVPEVVEEQQPEPQANAVVEEHVEVPTEDPTPAVPATEANEPQDLRTDVKEDEEVATPPIVEEKQLQTSTDEIIEEQVAAETNSKDDVPSEQASVPQVVEEPEPETQTNEVVEKRVEVPTEDPTSAVPAPEVDVHEDSKTDIKGESEVPSPEAIEEKQPDIPAPETVEEQVEAPASGVAEAEESPTSKTDVDEEAETLVSEVVAEPVIRVEEVEEHTEVPVVADAEADELVDSKADITVVEAATSEEIQPEVPESSEHVQEEPVPSDATPGAPTVETDELAVPAAKDETDGAAAKLEGQQPQTRAVELDESLEAKAEDVKEEVPTPVSEVAEDEIEGPVPAIPIVEAEEPAKPKADEEVEAPASEVVEDEQPEVSKSQIVEEHPDASIETDEPLESKPDVKDVAEAVAPFVEQQQPGESSSEAVEEKDKAPVADSAPADPSAEAEEPVDAKADAKQEAVAAASEAVEEKQPEEPASEVIEENQPELEGPELEAVDQPSEVSAIDLAPAISVAPADEPVEPEVDAKDNDEVPAGEVVEAQGETPVAGLASPVGPEVDVKEEEDPATRGVEGRELEAPAPEVVGTDLAPTIPVEADQPVEPEPEVKDEVEAPAPQVEEQQVEVLEDEVDEKQSEVPVAEPTSTTQIVETDEPVDSVDNAKEEVEVAVPEVVEALVGKEDAPEAEAVKEQAKTNVTEDIPVVETEEPVEPKEEVEVTEPDKEAGDVIEAQADALVADLTPSVGGGDPSDLTVDIKEIEVLKAEVVEEHAEASAISEVVEEESEVPVPDLSPAGETDDPAAREADVEPAVLEVTEEQQPETAASEVVEEQSEVPATPSIPVFESEEPADSQTDAKEEALATKVEEEQPEEKVDEVVEEQQVEAPAEDLAPAVPAIKKDEPAGPTGGALKEEEIPAAEVKEQKSEAEAGDVVEEAKAVEHPIGEETEATTEPTPVVPSAAPENFVKTDVPDAKEEVETTPEVFEEKQATPSELVQENPTEEQTEVSAESEEAAAPKEEKSEATREIVKDAAEQQASVEVGESSVDVKEEATPEVVEEQPSPISEPVQEQSAEAKTDGSLDSTPAVPPTSGLGEVEESTSETVEEYPRAAPVTNSTVPIEETSTEVAPLAIPSTETVETEESAVETKVDPQEEPASAQEPIVEEEQTPSDVVPEQSQDVSANDATPAIPPVAEDEPEVEEVKVEVAVEAESEIPPGQAVTEQLTPNDKVDVTQEPEVSPEEPHVVEEPVPAVPSVEAREAVEIDGAKSEDQPSAPVTEERQPPVDDQSDPVGESAPVIPTLTDEETVQPKEEEPKDESPIEVEVVQSLPIEETEADEESEVGPEKSTSPAPPVEPVTPIVETKDSSTIDDAKPVEESDIAAEEDAPVETEGPIVQDQPAISEPGDVEGEPEKFEDNVPAVVVEANDTPPSDEKPLEVVEEGEALRRPLADQTPDVETPAAVAEDTSSPQLVDIQAVEEPDQGESTVSPNLEVVEDSESAATTSVPEAIIHTDSNDKPEESTVPSAVPTEPVADHHPAEVTETVEPAPTNVDEVLVQDDKPTVETKPEEKEETAVPTTAATEEIGAIEPQEVDVGTKKDPASQEVENSTAEDVPAPRPEAQAQPPEIPELPTPETETASVEDHAIDHQDSETGVTEEEELEPMTFAEPESVPKAPETEEKQLVATTTQESEAESKPIDEESIPHPQPVLDEAPGLTAPANQQEVENTDDSSPPPTSNLEESQAYVVEEDSTSVVEIINEGAASEDNNIAVEESSTEPEIQAHPDDQTSIGDVSTSITNAASETVVDPVPSAVDDSVSTVPSESQPMTQDRADTSSVPQVNVIASATPRIEPLNLGSDEGNVELDPVPVADVPILPPTSSASAAFPDLNRSLYETVPIEALSPREELTSFEVSQQDTNPRDEEPSESAVQDEVPALASALASAADLPSAIEKAVESGLTPSAEALLDAVQGSLLEKIREQDDDPTPVKDEAEPSEAIASPTDGDKDESDPARHVVEASTESDATLVSSPEPNGTHTRSQTLQEEEPVAVEIKGDTHLSQDVAIIADKLNVEPAVVPAPDTAKSSDEKQTTETSSVAAPSTETA